MNTISHIKKTTIRNTTISFLFTMLLISFIGSQNTNAGIIDFESLPEMTASASTALAATEITTTSFTANWETFTAAVHYELYVLWSDPGILSKWRVVEGYNGIEVHGLEKIVTGLASNREYKYFIRARYKNNDESDPSNEIFVNTDDTGTSVNSITEANISIYPNPAQNHISIEGVEKNSTIDIFSITGAKMMRLENQSGSIKIDVSGLNNGLYIIKINSDNGDISRKIFVNK